jgi:putative tricarboxylic transport membrane protein
MDILQNMYLGFSVTLAPINLFYCFMGCLVGTLIGVLPGIGPIATISLLLPITFKLNPVSSIIMLSGIFYGAMYGGSTTSVLVNIPGEAASVVTCLDGHQMAKQGRAGAALGIAAIGSFIAGTISTLGLNLFSPLLVTAALEFGPPEYFSLMTLAFVVTLFMISGSKLKGLAMIVLGLFVSCIGMDVVNGQQRFTFGIFQLVNGFDLVPVVMGVFGVSEILINMEETLVREIFTDKIKGIWPNLRDLKDSALPIFRGSGLGFVLGLLPGAGVVTSSFVSYAVERKLSRHPEKFGKGAIEGVAGPESANNAAVAGAMIPLLSLGIPGNPTTAILMGALIIHGVQPGPMLISRNPEIFWGVIASFYVGNVMLLILNLPLIGIWVQLLKIPYRILFPLILLFCVIGTYSTNLNISDIWVMIGFSAIGFFLRKREYELAPFILAFVLGPLFEQSLRQSLLLSYQNPMTFITRPISAVLLAMSLILLIFILWENVCKRRVLKE